MDLSKSLQQVAIIARGLDVRCRLFGKNGGAAQSRCEPRHADVRAGRKERALVPYLNEVVGVAIGGVASDMLRRERKRLQQQIE